MLKRPITYKDFDGNEVTEEFYFHISKTELIGMKAEEIPELYEKIVKAQDNKQLFAEFKKIILMSYGEKSADGRSFVKTEELAQAFSYTAAFDTLIYELMTNEQAAADFINGVMPNDLAQIAAEAEEKAAAAKIAAAQTTASQPTN